MIFKFILLTLRTLHTIDSIVCCQCECLITIFPISGAEWAELVEGIVCQYSDLFIWGKKAVEERQFVLLMTAWFNLTEFPLVYAHLEYQGITGQLLAFNRYVRKAD